VVRVTAGLAGAVAGVLVLLIAGPPAPARRPGAPVRGARPMRATSLATAIDRVRPGRRRRRRDAQLPDAMDRVASALRAGDAVGPALQGVARDVPEPLGGELQQVAGAVARGASVADALGGWTRSDDTTPDVQLVVAALTLGAGAGGELARAVDGIASTLRERQELRGEVRALATQARASAAVLAAAPVAFALLVASVEPASAAFLVTEPAGVACLVLGAGLEVAGGVWMERITRGAG
jgi:tight adherence protein B